MLKEAKLPHGYWREVIYTTVYVQNEVQPIVNSVNAPYEPSLGRPASVNYSRVFGSKCYIKRDDDNLGKFHSRKDEGIFCGYSSTTRECKCYNIRFPNIIESENVIVGDTKLRIIEIQEIVYVKETDDAEIDDKEKQNFTRRGCF